MNLKNRILYLKAKNRIFKYHIQVCYEENISLLKFYLNYKDQKTVLIISRKLFLSTSSLYRCKL